MSYKTTNRALRRAFELGELMSIISGWLEAMGRGWRALVSPKIRVEGNFSAVQQSRLYVGNLSYNAKQDDLGRLFSKYGQLRNVYIVRDRLTRKLKGYAFVEMSNSEEAQRALELNGSEFLGRKILVSLAKSKRLGGRRPENRDHDLKS